MEVGPPMSVVSGVIALGVSQSPVAMAMFDKNMRYLAANRRWISDYHLDPESLIGRSHYEVFEDLPERWREIHRRGLAGEAIRSDMDVFPREERETLVVDWRVDPWREADGTVGGVLITAENVAENLHLRAAKEVVERELLALFDQRILGIVITDWTGVVLRANDRACLINGWSRSETVGRPFVQRVHDGDRAEIQSALDRLRVGQGWPLLGRHREIRPDGTIAWVGHAGALIQGREGSLPNAVIFLNDLTERVELEGRIREADRRASLAMLGACLGHDMNNILLPLRAHLNVIESLDRDVEYREIVHRSIGSIREGVRHLQHLADAMHFLSVESEPDEPKLSVRPRTSAPEWWALAESMLRAVFPSAVRLDVRIGKRLPGLAIDGHALTRAVLNLLLNSRDAIRGRHGAEGRGGVVILEVARYRQDGRSGVRLTVRDNGCGMTAQVRARACEPFFTTKPTGRGTGLGLAAVCRTVEQVGGSLSIESEPGIGTAVSMHLPPLR